MSKTQPCFLYFHPMSICSSMVRYTIANANATEPAQGSLALAVELRLMDIFKGDQLAEEYLCDINPKGQVPVLSSPGFLDKPITDSLDITLWLCERYPSLRPTKHAADVDRLLKQLHAINFFTLSMRDRPENASRMEVAVRAMMDKDGVSERHRKALEYKLTVHQSEKVEGIKPERIPIEIESARKVLAELNDIRTANTDNSNAEAWLFGTKAPTALDTTLVCFLARLMDVKLVELVPEPLLAFGKAKRETQPFKDIWASL